MYRVSDLAKIMNQEFDIMSVQYNTDGSATNIYNGKVTLRSALFFAQSSVLNDAKEYIKQINIYCMEDGENKAMAFIQNDGTIFI